MAKKPGGGSDKEHSIVPRRGTSPQMPKFDIRRLSTAPGKEVADFLNHLEFYLESSKKLQEDPSLIGVVTNILKRTEMGKFPDVLKTRAIQIISPIRFKDLLPLFSMILKNPKEEMNLRNEIARQFRGFGEAKEVEVMGEVTQHAATELKTFGDALRIKIEKKGEKSITKEEDLRFNQLQILFREFSTSYEFMCRRLNIKSKLDIDLSG